MGLIEEHPYYMAGISFIVLFFVVAIIDNKLDDTLVSSWSGATPWFFGILGFLYLIAFLSTKIKGGD